MLCFGLYFIGGDVEYAVGDGGQLAENLLHASGLCVGEEYLSEAVAADELDELFYAVEVEFVEYVVEQKNGFYARMVENILELSEFQCQRDGFLLALRGKLLHRKARQRKGEVVLVRADGGELCVAVGGLGLGQESCEVGAVGRRLI